MSKAKLPAGVIRSALEKNKKSARSIAIVLFGLWALIYLVPYGAIFSLSLQPPFLFTVVERFLEFELASFPWLSLLISAVLFFFIYSAVDYGMQLAKLDPAMLLSDHAKEHVEPADAVNQFETAWAQGEGEKWGKIWATPEWVFLGEASRLLRVEDLAWVYFRDSRTDKLVDGAKKTGVSAALQSTGAVSASQARRAGEDMMGDGEASAVLVVRSTPDVFATEMPCSDWNAGEVFALVTARNPDVVVGWCEEYETAWEVDRATFKEKAAAIRGALQMDQAPARKA